MSRRAPLVILFAAIALVALLIPLPYQVCPSWDVLVVDTLGFNDKFWFDYKGHPHTEKLHIVEKYRRPTFGHLEIEITIEDPEVLEGKWTIHRETVLSANDELQEYLCADNNRYLGRQLGK